MTARVLAGCAAAAVLLLLVLAGDGWSDAHPVILVPAFRIPTGVVALISAGVGMVGTFSVAAYGSDPQARRRIGYAALLPVLALAGSLLLVASVPTLSAPRAAAAMLLGSLAMIAGIRCVELIAAGEPIGFESHWGGLGGESGGWRLLPAASLAILTLSLAGGALAVLVAEAAKPTEHQAPQPDHPASQPEPKRSDLGPNVTIHLAFPILPDAARRPLKAGASAATASG